MNNEQLDRYSRQILLPAIDIEGQRKLMDASVTIIGCGGLGCHVAMQLAGAGVGNIRLIDFDRIELSNLHRQLYYRQADLDEYKAVALANRIGELNADVSVQVVTERFEQWYAQSGNDKQLGCAVRDTLWIDATDRYDVRVVINRAALHLKMPWISGAAVAWQAQWLAFGGEQGCYECMYPQAPSTTQTCEQSGVVSPMLVTAAAQQALLAIKMIVGLPVSFGQLTMADGLVGTWHQIAISPSAECVCST